MVNWNIDESFYPGPREPAPNMIWYSNTPPTSASSGDIWIDVSSSKKYTKFKELWLESKYV